MDEARLPKFRIEQRTSEPLLKADKPWEEFTLGYASVARVGDVWHLWYESYDRTYKSDADGFLCYARSRDGVKWEKPNLGLVEYGGNRNNNILLSGKTMGGVHGHTVFVDERAPETERFKIVFAKLKKGEWWVFGGTSADGIHWNIGEQPLLARNSDTQTVCFRDGDVYRLYVRMWTGGVYRGKRAVGYSESREFGKFPEPTVVLAPDERDAKTLHFYNSAASKLREGLYVMFPSGYDAASGLVRPHLAISADGKIFLRAGLDPVMEFGKGFDSKGIYWRPTRFPRANQERGGFFTTARTAVTTTNTIRSCVISVASGDFCWGKKERWRSKSRRREACGYFTNFLSTRSSHLAMRSWALTGSLDSGSEMA